jgi:hypothetical protein
VGARRRRPRIGRGEVRGNVLTMLETTYHHLLETSADAARQRLDAFLVAANDRKETVAE